MVIDLETSSLEEHGSPGQPARIVLASLTLPAAEPEPLTWVVPLSHPEGPWLGSWRSVVEKLATAVKEYAKPVVNHNLKFDLRWIHAHTGVDLAPLAAWDTMISSRLLEDTKSARLKEVAPRTFNVAPWDEFSLAGYGAAEKVSLVDLGVYAAQDTYYVWRLWQHHRQHLVWADDEEPHGPDGVENYKLGRLAELVSWPTLRTLTAVEQRGIGLDTDWCEHHCDQARQTEHDMTKALVEQYVPGPEGVPNFAPTSLWFREWADTAVAAGDLRIAATTPRGKPQWSKAVLTRQAREGSQVAYNLLKLRDSIKRQEFMQSWLSKVHNGRLYPSFNIGKTSSGRLSSSEPNLQQVSASLKPAFIPRPGYVMVEADLSQIELRLAAHIAKCQPMIDAYQAGEDLHTLTASAISGKALAEVTKQDRQQAKAVNFGLLYGMGAGGLREYAETAYGVVLTLEEAQHSRQTYFETYPELRLWHTNVIREVEMTQQVISPIGRVRRFEYLDDHAERQAINAPVQGMASDIMMIGCSLIDQLPDTHIVGSIHDSVVCEVPEQDWEHCTRRILECMTEAVYPVLWRLGCRLSVPLEAEAKVGTRWGLTDVGEVT